MTTITIGKRTFWLLISIAVIGQILCLCGIWEYGAVWALADLAAAVALIQSQLRGTKKEKVMAAIVATEKWLKSCIKCKRYRKTSGDLDIEGQEEREVELITVNYLPQISVS